ncbi:unnamed protein product [Lepeophtheirus salmonis]|uniref:(salmon louse) hypothetical protein n=1 Tax=Lepeophtheirus salmonis TaxID=72036 RepID=A0A7R8H4H2_LEPSM|nr:unnamed protein product [Lepeophtheirus salmonis]CAF2860581.1 unnamed protein product [Lepeophtheirus salmonis]
MVAKDSKDSVIYLKIPSNDEGEDSGNSYWNVRESKLWFWTLLFGTACNYAVRSSTPLVAHRPNIISKGGYLADRFGPEKVILLSSIIYGLLMFLVPIYFYGCLIMLDSISFISSEMCILVETHIVFYGKMSSGSSFGTLLRDVWLSITDLLWVLLRNFMSQELLFLDSALDRNYHQLSMTFHGSFTFEVPSLCIAILNNPGDIAPKHTGSVFGIVNCAGALPDFQSKGKVLRCTHCERIHAIAYFYYLINLDCPPLSQTSNVIINYFKSLGVDYIYNLKICEDIALQEQRWICYAEKTHGDWDSPLYKKLEASRRDFMDSNNIPDVDLVTTSVELEQMILADTFFSPMIFPESYAFDKNISRVLLKNELEVKSWLRIWGIL